MCVCACWQNVHRFFRSYLEIIKNDFDFRFKNRMFGFVCHDKSQNRKNVFTVNIDWEVEIFPNMPCDVVMAWNFNPIKIVE